MDLNDSAGLLELVPNAYFAALAIESGREWVTTDRDYARFPGLRQRHPLDDRARGRTTQIVSRP